MPAGMYMKADLNAILFFYLFQIPFMFFLWIEIFFFLDYDAL